VPPITTAVMLSRLAAIQFAMVAPSHAAVAISHALVAASISAYCPCQACCICRITVSISAIGARALGKTIMRLRRFGRTGRDLSEIGFGAWAISADWGHVEANDASATLNAALDAGMTFIDTADVYGDGRSERLIADVIKERGGERPFVATKAADVFDPLDQLGESGKIRHYGVSVERVEEGLKALDYPGVTSVQIIFNVVRQRPTELFFGEARRRGVAVIARVPLASGFLSGKFGPDTHFEDSDHRQYNRNGEAFDVGETFSGVDYAKGLDVVEKIRPLVGEDGGGRDRRDPGCQDARSGPCQRCRVRPARAVPGGHGAGEGDLRSGCPAIRRLPLVEQGRLARRLREPTHNSSSRTTPSRRTAS